MNEYTKLVGEMREMIDYATKHKEKKPELVAKAFPELKEDVRMRVMAFTQAFTIYALDRLVEDDDR